MVDIISFSTFAAASSASASDLQSFSFGLRPERVSYTRLAMVKGNAGCWFSLFLASPSPLSVVVSVLASGEPPEELVASPAAPSSGLKYEQALLRQT